MKVEMSYSASIRKPNGELLFVGRRSFDEVLDWLVDNSRSSDKFEILERRSQWASENCVVLAGNVDVLQAFVQSFFKDDASVKVKKGKK